MINYRLRNVSQAPGASSSVGGRADVNDYDCGCAGARPTTRHPTARALGDQVHRASFAKGQIVRNCQMVPSS